MTFRDAHGLLKVDCASRVWNGVQVRYFEKYPGPGKAFADMSSDLNTLAICLEQKGGHCEGKADVGVGGRKNEVRNHDRTPAPSTPEYSAHQM